MVCGGTTLSSMALLFVGSVVRFSAIAGCSTSLDSWSAFCRRQYLLVVKIFHFLCSKSMDCDEKLFSRFKFILISWIPNTELKFWQKFTQKCEFDLNVKCFILFAWPITFNYMHEILYVLHLLSNSDISNAHQEGRMTTGP